MTTAAVTRTTRVRLPNQPKLQGPRHRNTWMCRVKTKCATWLLSGWNLLTLCIALALSLVAPQSENKTLHTSIQVLLWRITTELSTQPVNVYIRLKIYALFSIHFINHTGWELVCRNEAITLDCQCCKFVLYTNWIFKYRGASPTEFPIEVRLPVKPPPESFKLI